MDATFWTACAAVATFAAAGVATWAVIVALKQGKKAGEQFLQARYDDARPILIVTPDSSKIQVKQEQPTCLEWDAGSHNVYVRNVGKGIALHLRAVLYGPEVVAVQNKESGQEQRETSYSDHHWWYWLADTVCTDEKDDKLLGFLKDSKPFEKQVKGKRQGKQQEAHSLNAEAQIAPNRLGQGPLRHICRLTLTYEDIFHRKHASIFDLVHQTGWQEIAIMEDIPHDLDELREGTK